MRRPRYKVAIVLSYLFSLSCSTYGWSLSHSRRDFVQLLTSSSFLPLVPSAAAAAATAAADEKMETKQAANLQPSPTPPSDFLTTSYGTEEYTNSLTASRDTNISPKEAYEVIRQHIPYRSNGGVAADMGAGAGVSTSVLYRELGYTQIDAVDWSEEAWKSHVTKQPSSIQFYAMNDRDFWERHKDKTYDAIVYNFAVNYSKAKSYAMQHLTKDGVLLAPVNEKADYWYKQIYVVLNSEGKILYQSPAEIGAWSVQFQPDVTSETCTGIWCGGFSAVR